MYYNFDLSIIQNMLKSYNIYFWDILQQLNSLSKPKIQFHYNHKKSNMFGQSAPVKIPHSCVAMVTMMQLF